MKSKLQPSPGYRSGDIEFRFRRAGHVLSISIVRPGGRWWITAAVQLLRSNPMQAAFAHKRLDRCSLDEARTITSSWSTTDCGASLYVGDAAFSLRPDEYAALREHLFPLGIPHEDAATKPVVRDTGRTYGGEVEGMGGDAEVSRL